jgi:hypothetical protein
VNNLRLTETEQPKANGQAPASPLLWSIDDLAPAMGMSRRTVERLEAAGAVGPVRVKLPGRLVRFSQTKSRKVKNFQRFRL